MSRLHGPIFRTSTSFRILINTEKHFNSMKTWGEKLHNRSLEQEFRSRRNKNLYSKHFQVFMVLFYLTSTHKLKTFLEENVTMTTQRKQPPGKSECFSFFESILTNVPSNVTVVSLVCSPLTSPNWSKPVQNGPNQSKPVQTSLNWCKPVQTNQSEPV